MISSGRWLSSATYDWQGAAAASREEGEVVLGGRDETERAAIWGISGESLANGEVTTIVRSSRGL